MVRACALVCVWALTAAASGQVLYHNGPLSTGTVSRSGVNAPSGFAWSELQSDQGNTTQSNGIAGFTGTLFETGPAFRLADDFTVPTGEEWRITGFLTFGHVTGSLPTATPITGGSLNVWDGPPDLPTSTIVGMATFSAMRNTNLYRIFNSTVPAPGATPGTTRLIREVEWETDLPLGPGTYWIDFQYLSGSFVFVPTVTIPNRRGIASWNAMQLTQSAWVEALDTGDPLPSPDVRQDFPFVVMGEITSPRVIYSNGPVGSGVTTRSGFIAPPGTQWSELQSDLGNTTESNAVAGYAGSRMGSGPQNRLADDFSIPEGESWNIRRLITYAYLTNSEHFASIMTGGNLNIWDGPPDLPTSSIVGTATFIGVRNDGFYRLFNTTTPPPGNTPGTTRLIRKVVWDTDLTLSHGRYWIDFQYISSTAVFVPSVTVVEKRGIPGWNAKEFTTSWINLIDIGVPATAPNVRQDIPFEVHGTVRRGQRLFAIDSFLLHELDPDTAALMGSTPLTGATFGVAGALAYAPDLDTLFFTSTTLDALFAVDHRTGHVTIIGGFDLGGAEIMHGLESDSAGTLYGFSSTIAQGARFFRINPVVGQAVPISDPGWGSFGSLAFVPERQTMYITDVAGRRLFTINRTTGATGLVGSLNTTSGQVGVGLAYHPRYGILAANNSGQDSLWRIDPFSGAASFIGNVATGNILSLAFVPADPVECYPDCDQSTGPGVLDIFDFLCFGNAFANNDPYACDCDTSTGSGVCDIFDFLCFGNAFSQGCR